MPFALHCFCRGSRAWIETFTQRRWLQWIWPVSMEELMDCQVSHILVQRRAVEVPPYQSLLQRLQLPLDCLTFFINSQVILFPWQQFPADTKNQVSPWKFQSVVGSLCVFICVQLRHHFQEETGVQLSGSELLFPHPLPALPYIQVMTSFYTFLFTTSDRSPQLPHCRAVSVLFQRKVSISIMLKRIGYSVDVI